jgi:phenylalanyl-tRNA synthetase alpha subunit
LDKVATVDPTDLQQEALSAAAEARTLAALSEVRIHYLGRSSALKLALRNVRDRETGMTLNAVRETVEAALTEREEELARAEL